MLGLLAPTPAAWLPLVLERFDEFLVDHAACERKASATGMMFVVRYPDRGELVREMIDFAQEELEHFKLVYQLIERRGAQLGADYKDEYVNQLLTQQRSGREALLLDRLLVSGIIEARGCERLKLVTDALPEGDERKPPYLEMTRAEARHHALFFRLARGYFPEAEVEVHARRLLEFEAELIGRLPVRPAVH